MKRFFMLALMLLVCGSVWAQDFQRYGRKAVALAPKGWTVEESVGDLNRDGVPDLLIMATPHDESKTYFNDDGVWVDENVPWIAVYWGAGNGAYRLYRAYEIDWGNGGLGSGYRAEITARGTIRLQFSVEVLGLFSSTLVDVFRWQNGDFMKIGHSSRKVNLDDDFTVLVSENYSTMRMQRLEYHGDVDSDSNKVEEWSDIVMEGGLERLGAH